MTEAVKWAVVVLSLLALARFGMIRRAGTVLRAIVARFGVLCLALLAITLPTTLAPNAARPAQAEGECSRVIPVDAMADFVIGTGATAALTFTTGTLSMTPPVVAGGATLTAAATPIVAPAVGTVALGAATLLGTIYGTCKFLDWVSGDGDQMEDTPLVATNDITVGALFGCGTLGQFPTSFGTGGNHKCQTITYGAAGTLVNGALFANQDRTLTYNGVTIAGAAASAMYPAVPNQSTGRGGVTWIAPTSPTTMCYTGAGITSSLGTGCTSLSTQGAITRVWSYNGCAIATQNIGGFCGRHPRSIDLLTTTTVHSTGSIQGAYHPHPSNRDFGWFRRIVTDVKCLGGVGSNSYRWVRAESAPFQDRKVSERVEVPSCDDGEIATKMISQRVPINHVCSMPGIASVDWIVCYGTGNVLSTFTMPDAMVTIGTAPAWVTCLTAGTDCGTPEIQGGVCVWGGVTVATSFCDADRQAGNPVTNPHTIPKETGTLTAPAYAPSGVDTADAPPSEPPAGTTVNVPIDPGTGQNTVTPSDGGDEPCIPVGWGWMNPVEWVLKPVKCAMLWAFVPDAEVVQDAWDGLMLDAQTNVPIAWIYKAHELVADSAAGAAGAVSSTADECLTVIPDGGDLVDTSPGQFCPATMSLGAVGAARPWLGYAVWLFWAWSMYGVLFRKGAPAQPEQLTLF